MGPSVVSESGLLILMRSQIVKIEVVCILTIVYLSVRAHHSVTLRYNP